MRREVRRDSKGERRQERGERREETACNDVPYCNVLGKLLQYIIDYPMLLVESCYG